MIISKNLYDLMNLTNVSNITNLTNIDALINMSNITFFSYLSNNNKSINDLSNDNKIFSTSNDNTPQIIGISILILIVVFFCYNNYEKAQKQLEKDKYELKRDKILNNL